MTGLSKFLRFSDEELKNDFYPLFLNLKQVSCELEAFLLILSTWNIGRFKFVANSFELEKFKKKIKELSPLFQKFNNLDFRTTNFDIYEKDIKEIFAILSDIRGVEKTGASKVMHIKIPKVFVMWDDNIRKHYGFGTGDADDYFNFLKKMQNIFKDYEIPSGERTFAKYIDEHNYKTITEPILKKNREYRLNKKSKK